MSNSYCHNCGVETNIEDAFCSQCGTKVKVNKKIQTQNSNTNIHTPTNSIYNQNTANMQIKQKSVGGAVLLTFLWPGLGHIYIGQSNIGIVLSVFTFIMWMLDLFINFALVIHVFYLIWTISSVIDLINKTNSGELTKNLELSEYDNIGRIK